MKTRISVSYNETPKFKKILQDLRSQVIDHETYEYQPFKAQVIEVSYLPAGRDSDGLHHEETWTFDFDVETEKPIE